MIGSLGSIVSSVDSSFLSDLLFQFHHRLKEVLVEPQFISIEAIDKGKLDLCVIS